MHYIIKPKIKRNTAGCTSRCTVKCADVKDKVHQTWKVSKLFKALRLYAPTVVGKIFGVQ